MLLKLNYSNIYNDAGMVVARETVHEITKTPGTEIANSEDHWHEEIVDKSCPSERNDDLAYAIILR